MTTSLQIIFTNSFSYILIQMTISIYIIYAFVIFRKCFLHCLCQYSLTISCRNVVHYPVRCIIILLWYQFWLLCHYYVAHAPYYETHTCKCQLLWQSTSQSNILVTYVTNLLKHVRSSQCQPATRDSLYLRCSSSKAISGLIPGLRPVNEKQRYFVTTYFIGWTQT